MAQHFQAQFLHPLHFGVRQSEVRADELLLLRSEVQRAELQIDAWDRTRLLEDLSRTFAETGINILEARCTVVHPMVKNRFVVEVGDTIALKNCISKLRNVESVFDAYRVTPSG